MVIEDNLSNLQILWYGLHLNFRGDFKKIEIY